MVEFIPVYAPKSTEVAEITQNNGRCAVKGHSRPSISVQMENHATCNVWNDSVPPILHRFRENGGLSIQFSLSTGGASL